MYLNYRLFVLQFYKRKNVIIFIYYFFLFLNLKATAAAPPKYPGSGRLRSHINVSQAMKYSPRKEAKFVSGNKVTRTDSLIFIMKEAVYHEINYFLFHESNSPILQALLTDTKCSTNSYST